MTASKGDMQIMTIAVYVLLKHVLHVMRFARFAHIPSCPLSSGAAQFRLPNFGSEKLGTQSPRVPTASSAPQTWQPLWASTVFVLGADKYPPLAPQHAPPRSSFTF